MSQRCAPRCFFLRNTPRAGLFALVRRTPENCISASQRALSSRTKRPPDLASPQHKPAACTRDHLGISLQKRVARDVAKGVVGQRLVTGAVQHVKLSTTSCLPACHSFRRSGWLDLLSQMCFSNFCIFLFSLFSLVVLFMPMPDQYPIFP